MSQIAYSTGSRMIYADSLPDLISQLSAQCDEVDAEVERLRAARDDLLAVCEAALHWVDDAATARLIEAAIAKATAPAPASADQ